MCHWLHGVCKDVFVEVGSLDVVEVEGDAKICVPIPSET